MHPFLFLSGILVTNLSFLWGKTASVFISSSSFMFPMFFCLLPFLPVSASIVQCLKITRSWKARSHSNGGCFPLMVGEADAQLHTFLLLCKPLFTAWQEPLFPGEWNQTTSSTMASHMHIGLLADNDRSKELS